MIMKYTKAKNQQIDNVKKYINKWLSYSHTNDNDKVIAGFNTKCLIKLLYDARDIKNLEKLRNIEYIIKKSRNIVNSKVNNIQIQNKRKTVNQKIQKELDQIKDN